MVATDGHRGGTRRVYYLLHLARIRKRALFRRAVHFALLLTLPNIELRPGREQFWPPDWALVDVASVANYFGIPARFSIYLLLLPQGLLPQFLAITPCLCGGRATRQVHG